MADDDEFGDEIDWSTVPLPSISASMAVPRAPMTASRNSYNGHQQQPMTAGGGGGARHRHSTGGARAVGHGGATYETGYYSQCVGGVGGSGMMSGQNHPRMTPGSVGVGDSDDALRKQIQALQNQLQTKDEQIFELEATAATSSAESTHRAQTAETNAEKRIHLVEEELRRMRMEAEKYKGSWIRQKKRVVELEQSQTKKYSGNGNGNHGHGDGNNYAGSHHAYGIPHGSSAVKRERMSNLRPWGSPSDVELRKVTPIGSTEEKYFDRKDHRHTQTNLGDDSDAIPTELYSSKKKRKAPDSSIDKDSIDDVAKYIPQQLVGGRGSGTSMIGDSVRQHMAKHLLNRHEMGCYSLPGSDCATELSSMLANPVAPIEMDVDHDAGVNKQHESDSNKREDEGTLQNYSPRTKSKATQQDFLVEKETQICAKSILYQMAEAPENIVPGTTAMGNLSISGLIHVLLVRFNSLFHHLNNEGGSNLDRDGDHVMEKENDPKKYDAPLNKCKAEYQSMALMLPKSVLSNEGENFSSSKLVTYATVSWRAALYLLNFLHDILLLSGKGRDDLRWWFYQCRQSPGSGAGGSPLNVQSPILAKHDTSKSARDTASNPRIEGLPLGRSGKLRADRKEVFWTRNCHSSSDGGESNVWDPMTMAQPCNTFFELLVGLMKGNVVAHPQNAKTEEEFSKCRIEQTLVQLVQLKAINLVLALMSDAPPYDEAKSSQGNRTPYLWKFWFDSLLPLHSIHHTASHNGSLDDTVPIGDFFSPLEKSVNHFGQLLGSGRRHSTRLLRDEPNDIIESIRRSAEKESRVGNKSSRRKSTTAASKVKHQELDALLVKRDKTKQHESLPILIKSRILQLLPHFMLSSSSVYKSMRKIGKGKEKTSLTKRVLAAILDDMEEYVVPFLSFCPSSDSHMHDADSCLQLCHSCIQFLVILSRSDEGIQMLRLQMRLEDEAWPEKDIPSSWSQSALGCVTLVLDSTLSFALGIEGKEDTVFISSHLGHALNTIVEKCIIFFKNILRFVCQQRDSSSKAATFLALICEHRTIFQSCCQKILTHQSLNSFTDPPHLLHFSEGVKYVVQQLFEEVLADEKEENGGGS